MNDVTQKKFSWRKVIFTLSLGLNILLIAGFVGAGYKAKELRDGGRGMAGNLGPLVRALPSEDRQTLRKELRPDRAFIKQRRTRQKALEEDFFAALRAMPFDPDRIAALQLENHAIREIGVKRFDEKWLNLLINMSDRERADYANSLAEILAKKDDKRKAPPAKP